jgi:hypothetical protein
MLLQLYSSLLLDTFEGADWDVPVWMRYCDPSRFSGVLKLLVTSHLGDLIPPVLLEDLDNLSAVHSGPSSVVQYTLNTHCVKNKMRRAGPSAWLANKTRRCYHAPMDEGRKRVLGTPSGTPETDKLILASVQWARKIMEKIDRSLSDKPD